MGEAQITVAMLRYFHENMPYCEEGFVSVESFFVDDSDALAVLLPVRRGE